MTAKHWGIVPAAGEGARMGAEAPKQYLKAEGTYILDHSIRALLACDAIEKIVVALAPQDTRWNDTDASRDARVLSCAGGAHRFASVVKALDHLGSKADISDDDWIVVHDGARPCLARRDLERLLHEIADEPTGGILALPIDDTVKHLDDGYIDKTLERERLVRAATPQVFRYHILKHAFERARLRDVVPPDEAAAAEYAGHSVKAVACGGSNIKVTRPQDLAYVTAFLKQHSDG